MVPSSPNGWYYGLRESLETPAMSDQPQFLILIITGSTLRAEQMDRPLAYYLQAEIEKCFDGQAGCPALVISDRYYLSHPDLRDFPFISVGGPGVNRLAQKLLKKLSAAFAVEDNFYIQMDPESDKPRASIWGMDNPQTQIAVLTFAERYLPKFVRTCCHRIPPA
jgi:hypothetical protein